MTRRAKTWASISEQRRAWFLERLDDTADNIERYQSKTDAEVYRAASAELKRAARQVKR